MPVSASEDKDETASAELPRRVVFEPTRVWEFHITISEKEYAAMQPRSRVARDGGAEVRILCRVPRERAAGMRAASRESEIQGGQPAFRHESSPGGATA
jgi:hypothetical protein